MDRFSAPRGAGPAEFHVAAGRRESCYDQNHMSFNLARVLRLVPLRSLVAVIGASLCAVVSATAADTRATGTKTPVRKDSMVPVVTTPRNKFCAVLPDGATFELVGVGESVDGKAWWDGDGSPRAKPRDVFRIGIGNPSQRDANGLRRLFMFECRPKGDASVSDPAFVGETKESGAGSFSPNVLGVKQTQSTLSVEIVPQSCATVRLKYASGKWTTVATCPPTRGTALALPQGGVLFGDPVEKTGGTQLPVALKTEIDDFRVVAIDQAMHEHDSTFATTIGGEGIRVLYREFANLRLNRIKEFRLLMRPWQQIEFRNISLHRGQKTNFAIFIDGKPYAAGTPKK